MTFNSQPFIKPACADLAEDEIFIPVVTSREEMQLSLSLCPPQRALAVFDAWMELERSLTFNLQPSTLN